MASKLDLGDPKTRAALLAHVQNHGIFEQFAQRYGRDRKTISRQLQRDPKFRRSLDTARQRAKCEANAATSSPPSSPPTQLAATSSPPAYMEPPTGAGVLPGLPALVVWRTWLWDTAKNEAAPPALRSKCSDIMARIIELPEEIRARCEAEQIGTVERAEGENSGLVILELPPKNTGDGEVITAELVH